MKNIIFDVGNVLVKWDPVGIIKAAFPDCQGPHKYLLLFKDTMAELDLGIMNFATAHTKLQEVLHTSKEKIDTLFEIFFSSLIVLPENIKLLNKLANDPAYSLYCLTNMSMECFEYLQRYDFWHNFKGIVVSADIKLIKPDPKIYIYILDKFNLEPTETIFIDDMLENIIAAKNLGIHGIHFTDLAACTDELKALKVLV